MKVIIYNKINPMGEIIINVEHITLTTNKTLCMLLSNNKELKFTKDEYEMFGIY